MKVVLGILIGLLLLVLASLLRMDPDQLIRRFSPIKRQDRLIRNWQFLTVIACLVAAQMLMFRWLAYPFESYWMVLVLSAYIPMTFMFFCNIVQVGNRRELIWTCVFLILCLSSLMMFEILRLELIILLSLLLTVRLCLEAYEDPYCDYRRALKCLDDAKEPDKAIIYLKKAVAGAPEEARYLYHLGRAYCGAKQIEEGWRLMRKAVQEDPLILDKLKADPLLRDEWLPQHSLLKEKTSVPSFSDE